jgi:two-component system cell cycle sensor histidine kinase/response regulator CckA
MPHRPALAGVPPWVWAAAGGSVLLTLWLVSPWRWFATAAIALLPAAAVALGIHVHRPQRRGSWQLFAIGLGIQFVGVIVLATAGGASADAAALPPLAIAGLVVVPAGLLVQITGAYGIIRVGPAVDRWSALDAGLFMVASGYLIWYLILDPAFDRRAPGLVPAPGLLAILLVDTLFLELGLRLLLSNRNGQPAFWIFLASTGFVLASELAFTSQVVDATYRFGGLTDLGLQAANIGWAVLALHPSMARLAGSAYRSRPGVVPWPRIVVMSMAALTVPTVLIVDAIAPGHDWDATDLLLAGVGTALVLWLVILRLGGSMQQLRRHRDALRASEERYRTLIERSSDAIFVIRSTGHIDEANATGATLLGYQPSDLVGRAWAGLVEGDELGTDQQHSTEPVPDRAMLFERRLRRSDGTSAPVEISATMLPDGRSLHIARDISERLRTDAERARLVDSLRNSQRDLEEAQQIAHVGSWTLDPATGAATWSDEMYRILGREQGGPAVDLADISRLFTPESVSEVSAAVERAISHGEPWHLGLETVRPDGTNGWVMSYGVVEHDDSGAVVRIHGTMQDVTDQRRLEGQLRQAQRLEGVGQLAGGIAHDFNNLLTAIRGYAELVRRELADDDAIRDDVDQVLLAADRATELTRQLLAFSRRQVLQPRVVDPAEIVTGIAPMLRRLLGEHVQLVTHLASESGRVKVDPSQLEQIIVNLAVNARDAMPDGGMLTIETMSLDLDAAYVATHAEGSPGPHVALTVSDTGIGMDDATKARIFEPFFTTKEPGKGTGMGLATVYGIVKQSGGSIYVYSEPGHGTSFKVYLPRLDEAATEESVDASPPAATTGSEVVLLVEDEEAVRSFAARVLTDQGYTVLQAANGAEAIALAAASDRQIDLLLTDVIMPGLQGHQLAVRLAADRPELRVLYVSGFTENSVIHHGVAGDGIAFLPKPFTAEALGRATRQVLDTSG